MPPSKQVVVQVPAVLQDVPAEVLKALPEATIKQVALLVGFRDMVGERWGYWFGARVKRGEMNEATKTLRKKANEISKKIRGEALEELITNGNIEGFRKIVRQLKEQRTKVSTKSKPFREKINPLNKAVKYLDNIAIPDALKELGTPVQPRFTLSDYVQKAMESD